MNIIMLGAPGTGKGTIASILSQELGIPQISTGDIFRKNIKEGTELGKLQQEDAKNGAILDGFPRTVVQADKLKEILSAKGKKVDITINLTTPEEEIIERIVNRRVCSNQECKTVYNVVLHPPKVEGICDKCGSELITRKDDKLETVKSRLEQYFITTSPLVEYYEKEGILYSAVVSKSINKLGADVAKDILEHLKTI